MKLLEGKTAIVTGGGTGIGFGCAQRLLEHGARVLICGRRDDVLRDAVGRLQERVSDGAVSMKVCDITEPDDVQEVVAEASAGQGLDIFVANAGSGYPAPILEAEPDTFRFCCELNILGTANCIRYAGQAMKKTGGSIVTISSVEGAAVAKWMSAYSTTKAALEMLTKCAAVELASFNIRVNCIQPGYVITEATEEFVPPELKARLVEKTPLARAGQPEEIGDGVIYLSSDMGKWVTGQVFGICGGLSVHVGEDFIELNRMMLGDEVMDACMGPMQ